MALWTPYTDKALDLSRVSANRERESPPEDTYHYRCIATVPVRHYAPLAQASPDSVRSKLTPSPSQSPELYDLESLDDDVEYQAFERDALCAMAEKSGGTLLGNNPRMRRAVHTSQEADESYRKQRAKNNWAAKQSRDRRKLREVRLAFQVTFLKKKLAAMRARLAERFCVRCQHQCQC